MEKDFKKLLGGVKLDANGEIVSATAIMFTFFGKMNGTAARIEDVGMENALGAFVDKKTLDFEAELIRVLTDKSDFTDGFNSDLNVARSFNDIASSNIITDVTKVAAGFMIVFMYVILMLGRFDLVHHRVSSR